MRPSVRLLHRIGIAAFSGLARQVWQLIAPPLGDLAGGSASCRGHRQARGGVDLRTAPPTPPKAARTSDRPLAHAVFEILGADVAPFMLFGIAADGGARELEIGSAGSGFGPWR